MNDSEYTNQPQIIHLDAVHMLVVTAVPLSRSVRWSYGSRGGRLGCVSADYTASLWVHRWCLLECCSHQHTSWHTV